MISNALWNSPPLHRQALGAFRICFYLFVFWQLGWDDRPLSWQEVPLELWHGQGLTGVLAPLFQATNHFSLLGIWRISLILAALGLFTRLATLSALVSGFLLIGYAQSFGYFTRLYMPILWSLLILAVSPVGDGLSVDQWFKAKKAKPSTVIQEASVGYALPLVALQIVFCTIFFQAGLSKLILGGWQWMSGVSLQNYMLKSYVWPFNPSDRIFFPINKLFFDHLSLCQITAWGALATELLSPLALFSRKWRGPLIAALLIMQLVIRFTIFVNFTLYGALYLAWLPWGQLTQTAQKLLTSWWRGGRHP